MPELAQDRFALEDVFPIAATVTKLLRPATERIMIAGSIRRAKPKALIKDIEIVCIPNIRRTPGLFSDFDEPATGPFLSDTLDELIADGLITKQLNSFGRPRAWGDRYMAGIVNHHGYKIPLDIFCVLPPAEWGVILTIRTGCADFVRHLVTHRAKGGLLPDHLTIKQGELWRTDRGREAVKIPTPDEKSFFAEIGIPYVEPQDRCEDGNGCMPWEF